MVRRALCLWRGGLLETRDEWSPGAKVMLDSALPVQMQPPLAFYVAMCSLPSGSLPCP